MRIRALTVVLLAVPFLAVAETVHLQVVASADDAHAYGSAGLLTSLGFPRFGQNSMLEAYESAARFVDIAIDSGASIDSAFLEFRAHTSWSSDSIVYEVVAEDTAGSSAFTNRADYDLRLGNLTAASSPQVLYGSTADNWYRSPDVAEMLEAIVARPDWQKGSSDITLFLRPTGDSPADVWFEMYHFEGDNASAHRLHIYMSDDTGVPTPLRRKKIISNAMLSGGH
jgi:hypothetical protein